MTHTPLSLALSQSTAMLAQFPQKSSKAEEHTWHNNVGEAVQRCVKIGVKPIIIAFPGALVMSASQIIIQPSLIIT